MTPASWTWLFGALHLLAACGLVLTLRKGEAAALGIGVAVAVLVWAGVTPESLPTSWLVPLQEGTTDTAVRLARGESAHAGYAFHRFYAWPMLGTARRLDTLVAWHLAVWAGCWATLLALLVQREARLAAIGVGATLGLPVAWGVWSAGPGPLIWPWLGILWWLWTHERGGWRGWMGRLGALAALGIAAGLRTELLALGAVMATAAGLSRTALPDRADRWWRQHGRRVLGGVSACLLLGLVAGDVVLPSHTAHGIWSWFIAVAHPLDPSPLALPVVLLALWPPGIALLVGAGLVGGLRHPVRTGGAAVALLAMWKLYASAAHGGFLFRYGDLAFFELVRYLGLLAPLVLLVAWQGWMRVRSQALAPWVLALCLVPPVPSIANLWPKMTPVSGVALWRPVARDLQAEVRFLVEVLREHPSCGIVAQSGEDWMVFVGPDSIGDRSEARMLRVRSPSMAEARAAMPADVPCVLGMRGHACAVGPCSGEVGAVRMEDVYEGPAYAHPTHGWTAEGPIRFMVWTVE